MLQKVLAPTIVAASLRKLQDSSEMLRGAKRQHGRYLGFWRRLDRPPCKDDAVSDLSCFGLLQRTGNCIL